MQYFLIFLLPVQSARDVHETSRVADDQSGGLTAFKIADLSLQPFCRKFRMFHRHDSPKAATFVCMRHLYDLRTTDVCQQRPRLWVNVHGAQAMTGWMVGEYSIPACAEIGDTQFVHEIFCKFMDAPGKYLS